MKRIAAADGQNRFISYNSDLLCKCLREASDVQTTSPPRGSVETICICSIDNFKTSYYRIRPVLPSEKSPSEGRFWSFLSCVSVCVGEVGGGKYLGDKHLQRFGPPEKTKKCSLSAHNRRRFLILHKSQKVLQIGILANLLDRLTNTGAKAFLRGAWTKILPKILSSLRRIE